jgi:hypothetical protein
LGGAPLHLIADNMSTLDLDFDKIVEDIDYKVRLAARLLLEASELANKNSLLIDKGDIENISNIVKDLPTESWDSSESQNEYWSSSTSECW